MLDVPKLNHELLEEESKNGFGKGSV